MVVSFELIQKTFYYNNNNRESIIVSKTSVVGLGSHYP